MTYHFMSSTYNLNMINEIKSYSKKTEGSKTHQILRNLTSSPSSFVALNSWKLVEDIFLLEGNSTLVQIPMLDNKSGDK